MRSTAKHENAVKNEKCSIKWTTKCSNEWEDVCSSHTCGLDYMIVPLSQCDRTTIAISALTQPPIWIFTCLIGVLLTSSTPFLLPPNSTHHTYIIPPVFNSTIGFNIYPHVHPFKCSHNAIIWRDRGLKLKRAKQVRWVGCGVDLEVDERLQLVRLQYDYWQVSRSNGRIVLPKYSDVLWFLPRNFPDREEKSSYLDVVKNRYYNWELLGEEVDDAGGVFLTSSPENQPHQDLASYDTSQHQWDWSEKKQVPDVDRTERATSSDSLGSWESILELLLGNGQPRIPRFAANAPVRKERQQGMVRRSLWEMKDGLSRWGPPRTAISTT